MWTGACLEPIYYRKNSVYTGVQDTRNMHTQKRSPRKLHSLLGIAIEDSLEHESSFFDNIWPRKLHHGFVSEFEYPIARTHMCIYSDEDGASQFRPPRAVHVLSNH